MHLYGWHPRGHAGYEALRQAIMNNRALDNDLT
jgi:hypothetical protein